MKTKKTFLLLSALALAAISPLSNAQDVKPQLNDYLTYGNAVVNGYKIDYCTVVEDGMNICDKKTFEKIQKLAESTKPNFGKNKEAVLIRVWDKDFGSWIYTAVNTKTKMAHTFPRGVRALFGGNRKAGMLKIDQKNRLCTSGDNIDLSGTMITKSVSDQDTKTDLCSEYDAESGFGGLNLYDAKTRKFIDYTLY